MEKVMKYFTGFLGGIVAILMAIVPVTILWTLLTGDNMFGTGGFTGLVVLVMLMGFFVKK